MKEIQLQIGKSVYAILAQALEHAVVITTDIEPHEVATKLQDDDAGAHALSYLSSPAIYEAVKNDIRYVVGAEIELTHELVMSAWVKTVTRVGQE